MRTSQGIRCGALRSCAAAVIAIGMACSLFAGAAISRAYADDGSLTAGAALQAQELEAQPVDYAIDWYAETPDADEFTIASVPDLKGFAKLVNGTVDPGVSGKPAGPVDFEGKTVKLGGQLILAGHEIEPIGTVDHPFQGTFDGQRTDNSAPLGGQSLMAFVKAQAMGNMLVNYSLTVPDSGENISYKGLFGYAGDKASIKNLLMLGGEVRVTNTTAAKRITDVGVIAGHLGGSIENCKSTADLYVVNDGAVPDKMGRMPDEICTIMYVGGLVGSLTGDLIDCEHGNANGIDEDAVLSISSSAAATEKVPFIASYVGGLVGLQGDETHGDVVWQTKNCANYGMLDFSGINGTATADRFGNINYAKSSVVGGIVGYSIASFSHCSNHATINTGIIGANGNPQAEHGARNTGGIVGALRAPRVTNPTVEMVSMGTDTTDPGYDVWTNSGGTTQAPLLTVERCQNMGYIVGLAAVGGIVGSDGAFTEIVGCANSGNIDGTRSVKPCPAGIAGISNGDIAYCSNTGRIRTTTGAGYYASGIAGLLTTYNIAGMEPALMLDPAQIYGCYTTGLIVSTEAGGFRTAVIAAENDGFIHDNCFLPNLTVDKTIPREWQGSLDCIDDEDGSIAPDDVEAVEEVLERVNVLEGKSFAVVGGVLAGGTKVELEKCCKRSQLVVPDEDRGTRARNYELTSDELKGSRGVACLNRPTGVSGDWSDEANYFLVSASGGFPVLSWLGGGVEGSIDLDEASELSVQVVQGPEYSAASTPMPTIEVRIGGAKLYQDADFRVVVDPDAREVGEDYRATIVGMNRYTGTLSDAAAYQVRKCAVGNCNISATSQVFNWERQEPAKVVLLDDAGNALAVDKKGTAGDAEFVWSIPETPEGADETGRTRFSDGKFYDYTNVHSGEYQYDIVVEAKETSQHYIGRTQQAAFQIKTASLYQSPLGSEVEGRDPSAHYDTVVWEDQEWDYVEAYATKGLMKIKYTGSPIEPTIKNPTFLGRPLHDGTGLKYWLSPLDYDFRYVYGNPNPDPGNVQSFDCVNATGSAETDLACVSVRNTQGGNFFNYIDLFFEITPANIADDVSVSGANRSYAYTGKAIRPLTLTYNGMTLKEGADFTASYAGNVNAGTATVTITGKGNYAGSVVKTFTIAKAANPLSVKVSQKTVKAKNLKKKAQKASALKIVRAAGKVSFKLVKDKKTKKFKVDSKGKVTVPKGAKKGTYKVKVKVTAAGDANHEPATKTVTAKVKVK